jgi:hypothetical protein
MRVVQVFLVPVLLLACSTTAAASEERRNWFDDPFARATSGLARCPVPDGPEMTEAEMRADSHARAERGTRCWQEKKCDSPSAYKYDKPINENALTRIAGDPRFKDTSVWVRTLRGFVFLQGCVSTRKQREQMIGAVGALPRVERVIDELQVGTSGKPPYKLPPPR